jgi:glycosyltransferase involved in cell wall biosynthesis
LLAPYKDLDNFRNHLPNKFMEYSSSGKPMLSSLRGTASDFLEEHQCGITYADGDELFSAIDKYSSNNDMCEQHASNARKMYLERFHPDVIMSGLEKWLRSNWF